MNPPHVAKDIMVTRLVTVSPETGVFEAIARLLKANVTGAPVIDENSHYAGVFSDRCCIKVLAAEMANAHGPESKDCPLAQDMMATKLLTLHPAMDVFEAIGLLLKARVSGAPVIDDNQRFLGVFSEKTSMTVLVTAVFEQLPNCHVEAFTDTDPHRTIEGHEDMLSVCRMFLETPYRRLPVLQNGRLIGQVSRRDLLNAANSRYAPSRPSMLSRWLASSNENAPGEAERVAAFMDASASTIDEEIDLLGIVQIFRETNHRRLPVLRGKKLVGQVSRRDVLHAIDSMMASPDSREKTLLYLSSLVDGRDAPIH